MSTYDQRWYAAHIHSVKMGEEAAAKAPPDKSGEAYSVTYRSEMDAFAQLEALRRPVENQSEIDAEAAAKLRGDGE